MSDWSLWLLVFIWVHYSTTTGSLSPPLDTFLTSNRLISDSVKGNENGELKLCQSSGPGMIGDLLRDPGCHLDAKSGAHHSVSEILRNDTAVQSLRRWSLQVMRSASEASGQATDSGRGRSADALDSGSQCGSAWCLSPPTCCQVDVKLTFPLYGRSLASDAMVEIVQEVEGIQQPIVYRQCRSSETNVVRGRCLQSSLPRLMYVRPPVGQSTVRKGYGLNQDVLLMPSNCECIVSLASGSTDNQHVTEARPGASDSLFPSRMPPQFFVPNEVLTRPTTAADNVSPPPDARTTASTTITQTTPASMPLTTTATEPTTTEPTSTTKIAMTTAAAAAKTAVFGLRTTVKRSAFVFPIRTATKTASTLATPRTMATEATTTTSNQTVVEVPKTAQSKYVNVSMGGFAAFDRSHLERRQNDDVDF